jgi:hypothetical protein
MTELFIDGKRAVLAEGSSFKVTMENPYFTKASEYSNEVELPIPNKYNSAIFGAQHRRDTAKAGTTKPCRLVVDNRTLIEGTATVTEITESTIKVQLLGGNSYVNYQTRFESLYIDELDLGSVADSYWDLVNGEQVDKPMTWHFTETIEDKEVTTELPVETTTHLRYWLEEQFAEMGSESYGGTPQMQPNWLMLPAIRADEDDESEKFVNRREYRDGTLIFEPWSRYSARVNNDWQIDNKIAPQPLMSFIVERVIERLGYSVSENGLTETWLQYLYIPNVTSTLEYAKMLPHWTVNDFLTAVENFFGVCFIFNTKNNTCRIACRKSMYGGDAQLIQISDDAFSVSVDEDDTTDVSNANISYKMDDDLKHCFNDDLNEGARFQDFATLAAAEAYFRKGSYYGAANEYTGTVAVVGGRYYIYYNKATTEVNELAPLERGEDNESIELTITPAVMGNAPTKIMAIDSSASTDDKWTKCTGTADCPAPTAPVMSHQEEWLNIAEVIDGNDSSSSSNETLPVALYKPDASISAKQQHGWTYGHDDITSDGFADKPFALRLHSVDGMETHFDLVYSGEVAIDTTAPIEVTYYDDAIYDPTATFMDRGQKMACQKIEYIVDEWGIQKAKTGTFFQIRG